MAHDEARDHLINVLGAFVTAVEDDVRARLEDEVGAQDPDPAALLALDTWPDRSVGFLAGILGLSHSGAVRLVDRLVGQGLAERRPGPDGRTAALRLTRAGRRRAHRVREVRYGLLAELVDALGASERDVLGAALDRVLRGGRRTRTEARRSCRFCDHTVCRGEACPIGASVEEPRSG